MTSPTDVDCCALLDDLDAVVWEADPNRLAFSSISDKAQQLLGYPVRAWKTDVGLWRRLIHDDDRDWVMNLCSAIVEEGGNHTLEYRMVSKDGRICWVRDVLRVLPAAVGRPRRLVGATVDITQRRHAEQTAAIRDGLFRALIEHALDIITVLDEGGVVAFASPSTERILGYRPTELLGRSVSEFVHPDDLPRVRAAFERALIAPGPSPFIEFRARHKNGEWRILESVGRRVSDQGTTMMGIVNSRDITDRRLLEKQFRQAQKNDALARLMGVVAHDFNNLLVAVLGFTELLMDSEATLPFRSELREIKSASETAATLTHQFLMFSRRKPAEAENVDANLAVIEIETLLRRMLAPKVELELELAADPAVTRVDKGLLHQVLVNLTVNARDAMLEGGRVRIRTHNTTMPVEVDGIAIGEAIPYVAIEISDTGIGMSAAVKDKIFEPFFTTKDAGKGSGLGLATVFGIVRDAGGYIEVESEEGQGSTFRVHLRTV